MTTHTERSPAFDVARHSRGFSDPGHAGAQYRRAAGVPLVYLDNAATTQHPRQVIQAITDVYEKHYANVHRGIHWLSDQTTDLYEAARAKVPRFHRRAVRRAGHLHPRHNREHQPRGSQLGRRQCPRRRRDPAYRDGAPLQHRPLAPGGRADRRGGALLADYRRRSIGARPAGRVSRLAHADGRAGGRRLNVLGTINPLEAVIARAHEPGAVVLVDAAQSVPHQRTDVARLDADFLAFSAATRCSGPRASACCMAAASCWRRCRRSWAAAA